MPLADRAIEKSPPAFGLVLTTGYLRNGRIHAPQCGSSAMGCLHPAHRRLSKGYSARSSPRPPIPAENALGDMTKQNGECWKHRRLPRLGHSARGGRVPRLPPLPTWPGSGFFSGLLVSGRVHSVLKRVRRHAGPLLVSLMTCVEERCNGCQCVPHPRA